LASLGFQLGITVDTKNRVYEAEDPTRYRGVIAFIDLMGQQDLAVARSIVQKGGRALIFTTPRTAVGDLRQPLEELFGVSAAFDRLRAPTGIFDQLPVWAGLRTAFDGYYTIFSHYLTPGPDSSCVLTVTGDGKTRCVGVHVRIGSGEAFVMAVVNHHTYSYNAAGFPLTDAAVKLMDNEEAARRALRWLVRH
jgi:hypothetical protein